MSTADKPEGWQPPPPANTRYCVDCSHCQVVTSVTATGEPTYNCLGITSEITGKPVKMVCHEARIICKGKLWQPKS